MYHFQEDQIFFWPEKLLLKIDNVLFLMAPNRKVLDNIRKSFESLDLQDTTKKIQICLINM